MRYTILLLIAVLSCADTTKEDTKVPRDYATTHAEALSFCKDQGFNTDYYFLVDMSVHSGSNRFFVYDFNEARVVDSGLATHGSCDAYEPNDTKIPKG